MLAYVNPYFSYDDFVVNRRFDIRQPEAQRFMEEWCRTLHESELVQKVKNKRCVIQDFREHVELILRKRFPVPEDEFDDAFESFLKANNQVHMQAGLVGFARMDQCRVLFMGVALRAQFKKSTGAWEMQEVWNDWQKLLKRKNDVAPSSVGSAIIVSDAFVSMATQVEAIMSTALSIWLACVLVVFIVFFCTGSLQMAILILINLMFIVVFVIAGLAYLKMEFGGVEVGPYKLNPIISNSLKKPLVLTLAPIKCKPGFEVCCFQTQLVVPLHRGHRSHCAHRHVMRLLSSPLRHFPHQPLQVPAGRVTSRMQLNAVVHEIVSALLVSTLDPIKKKNGFSKFSFVKFNLPLRPAASASRWGSAR
jgi:hypothetical protein